MGKDEKEKGESERVSSSCEFVVKFVLLHCFPCHNVTENKDEK